MSLKSGFGKKLWAKGTSTYVTDLAESWKAMKKQKAFTDAMKSDETLAVHVLLECVTPETRSELEAAMRGRNLTVSKLEMAAALLYTRFAQYFEDSSNQSVLAQEVGVGKNNREGQVKLLREIYYWSAKHVLAQCMTVAKEPSKDPFADEMSNEDESDDDNDTEVESFEDSVEDLAGLDEAEREEALKAKADEEALAKREAESAAAAAVLASKQGTTPANVPLDDIKRLLNEHGAIIPKEV